MLFHVARVVKTIPGGAALIKKTHFASSERKGRAKNKGKILGTKLIMDRNRSRILLWPVITGFTLRAFCAAQPQLNRFLPPPHIMSEFVIDDTMADNTSGFAMFLFNLQAVRGNLGAPTSRLFMHARYLLFKRLISVACTQTFKGTLETWTVDGVSYGEDPRPGGPSWLS